MTATLTVICASVSGCPSRLRAAVASCPHYPHRLCAAAAEAPAQPRPAAHSTCAHVPAGPPARKPPAPSQILPAEHGRPPRGTLPGRPSLLPHGSAPSAGPAYGWGWGWAHVDPGGCFPRGFLACVASPFRGAPADSSCVMSASPATPSSLRNLGGASSNDVQAKCRTQASVSETYPYFFSSSPDVATKTPLLHS